MSTSMHTYTDQHGTRWLLVDVDSDADAERLARDLPTVAAGSIGTALRDAFDESERRAAIHRGRRTRADLAAFDRAHGR